jgi:hypothetical protein
MVGGAAGLAGLAVAVAAIIVERGEQSTTTFVDEAMASHSSDDLGASGFLSLGKFLTGKGADADQPVIEESIRAGFSAVRVQPGATVALGEDAGWQLVGFFETLVLLSGETSHGDVRVALMGRPGDLVMSRLDGQIVIAPDAAAPVTLLIEIREAQNGLQYRAGVSRTGELFRYAAENSAGVPVDLATGAALDISAARLLGRLELAAAARADTRCEGGTCRVVVQTPDGLLESPVDGRIDCSDGMRILALAATLNVSSSSDIQCTPGTTSAGGLIALGAPRASISAKDSAGAQISVGIARDGTIWAGVFAATATCPCRPVP